MSNYKTVYIPCTYLKAKSLGVEYSTTEIEQDVLQKNLQYALDEEDALGYKLISTTGILGTSVQGFTKTNGLQLIFEKNEQ